MILAWSLLHESGEEKAGEWPLGPVSQKPQTLGSMITYGRRYSFSAAINIVVEDDDDGQRAQNDHSSRQSAGDVWENAKPAPPRQNGGNGNDQRGQVSRPAPAAAAAPAAVPDVPEDIDPAAQAYADEAHGAVTLNEIEDIQRRAREDSKLLALVRNPAAGEGGKPGQLALYIDWRRKAVKEGEDALAELVKAATEREVGDIDGWFRSVMNTEINGATASQLRTALKTLREKAAAAA